MRIRCVDKDGRSFFAEIGFDYYPHAIQLARLAPWPEGGLVAALRDGVEPVEVQTETYECDIERPAYGPFACPVDDLIDDTYDVVYRYRSEGS